jgi:hypothetical protein
MEARPPRLLALLAGVAVLAIGGFVAGRQTVGDDARPAPRPLAAARPAPRAPRLPPAAGIPKLKTRPEEVQTFNP